MAKYAAGALGGMCGHYERKAEIERGYERGNIDPARTPDNYNLAPERERGQVGFIEDRIASLDLKRAPRKDAIRMCDCAVTMPKSLDPTREREFFESAYRFLSDRYGPDNVVSSYVHVDESQPHMHFAWVPVTPDGRLSAKEVVCRRDLRTLHSDMQKALESDMGCPVEVLLDPEKQGEKQLSRLSQDEYVAAQKRLERLRREVEEKRYPKDVREAIDSARGGDGLEGRVAGLREERDAAKERVGSLERQRGARRARVGALARAISKAKGACTVLAARVARLQARFAGKEQPSAVGFAIAEAARRRSRATAAPDCGREVGHGNRNRALRGPDRGRGARRG